MNMKPQPTEPNEPPNCTLTTEQWNVVLGHLDAGQHRIVRPIIDSLMAQLQQQSQASPPLSTDEMQRAIPDGP